MKSVTYLCAINLRNIYAVYLDSFIKNLNQIQYLTLYGFLWTNFQTVFDLYLFY